MSTHESDSKRDAAKTDDGQRDPKMRAGERLDDEKRHAEEKHNNQRRDKGKDDDKGRGRGSDADAQHEARGTPNPVQVQKYLGGLDYPVDKEAVLRKAREEGADERVLDALEQLPDRDFDSPISISRELGKLG